MKQWKTRHAFPSRNIASNMPSKRVRRGKSGSLLPQLLVFVAVVSFAGSLLLSRALEKSQRPTDQNQPLIRRQQEQRPSLNASIEVATSFLVELARKPLDQLLIVIQMEDVFHLSKLNSTCPFRDASSLPLWYIEPSSPPKDFINDKRMLLWYEHLSKAGGTSFCKLAQRNMKSQEVPRYYCMPPDGKEVDGRVGRWSNDKLMEYKKENPSIRIVSNEWNPFSEQRWEISDKLLLVTTLRDPMDRLLSAYRFWGILHNKADSPTFAQWLHRKFYVSDRNKPFDMSLASHVGRFNFLVWKFSRGTMPQASKAGSDNTVFPNFIAFQEEALWKEPFVEAISTLAHFDLVFVLELLGQYPQPMVKRLGWTQLDKNHVVPSGKIENNDADALNPDEYKTLWDANRFDMILYLWMKAMYLTRIQCESMLKR